MGRSCINLVGNTTQGQNLGTGTTVFAGKSTSNTLSFKSLSALGDGISITCDGNNIYLSGQTGSSGGQSYTFNNGLTESGGVVSLGGTGVTSYCFQYNDGISYDEYSWGGTNSSRYHDYYIESLDGNCYIWNYECLNFGEIEFSTTVNSETGSLYMQSNSVQFTAYGFSNTSSVNVCGTGCIRLHSTSRGVTVPNLATEPTLGNFNNGDLYYNTTDNKFRGYENGTWKDIITTGSTGSGTTYTFNNGLTEAGDVVSLGGTLTGDTLIDGQFDLRLGYHILSCRLGEFETFSNSTCITAGDLFGAPSACTSFITMGSGFYNLAYSEANVGNKSISLHNNDKEPIRISDSYCNVGMIYCADYSANGSTNPRWIPDAAWVTGQTGGGGSGTTYIFNNGLTEGGDIVSLGGTLTGNTTLNYDGNVFTQIIDSSQNHCILQYEGGVEYIMNNPTQCCGVFQFLINDVELSLRDCVSSFSSNISQSVNDIILTKSQSVGCSISLNLSDSSIVITDTINSIGMSYAIDYSTSGSTNPRWIPDNAYVTGLTTPAGNDGQLQYNNAGTWGATDLCYDDSTNTYGIDITPSADTIISIFDDSPYNSEACIFNVFNSNNNTNIFRLSHNNGLSIVSTSIICGFSCGTIGSDLSINIGSNETTRIGNVNLCNNCVGPASGTGFIVGGNSIGDCVTIQRALNLTAFDDFPSTPSEGTLVRLSGHATCSDGYYVYNGSSWQTLSTW